MILSILLASLMLLTGQQSAQQPTPPSNQPTRPTDAQVRAPERPIPEEIPVVTNHEIQVNGKTLRYAALPKKSSSGHVESRNRKIYNS
jgi:hypothetical protein